MATQKGLEKWKQKKWFAVHAPKVFDEKVIGEIPSNEDSPVVGRSIKVGLNTLTGNPGHAYTNAIFRITETNGNVANTKLIRMELPYSYIKSLARKYKSVINSILPVTNKDGAKLVVKCIVITRERTGNAKVKGMRHELEEFAMSYFKAISTDDAIKALIEGRFQSELASKLDHIAEVEKVEVKKLEIL